MTATEDNSRIRQGLLSWLAPTAPILILALVMLVYEVVFHAPPLFGANEAILQGSVIISISIIGGFIASVYLQLLFVEWKNFGETLESEGRARRQLKQLQRKLKSADELIENNRAYEAEVANAGGSRAAPLIQHF